MAFTKVYAFVTIPRCRDGKHGAVTVHRSCGLVRPTRSVGGKVALLHSKWLGEKMLRRTRGNRGSDLKSSEVEFGCFRVRQNTPSLRGVRRFRSQRKNDVSDETNALLGASVLSLIGCGASPRSVALFGSPDVMFEGWTGLDHD